MPWDPDQLSRDFQFRAEQAEIRMEECRRRVPHSSGHKMAHDMALGDFYTFNHLHGRTFLSSQKALVEELKAMKGMNFKTGASSAYDKEDFERWRIKAIDELLNRFEALPDPTCT